MSKKDQNRTLFTVKWTATVNGKDIPRELKGLTEPKGATRCAFRRHGQVILESTGEVMADFRTQREKNAERKDKADALTKQIQEAEATDQPVAEPKPKRKRKPKAVAVEEVV